MTDVDACETHPDEAWALNARLVEVIGTAAARAGARFTTLSTDYDGSPRDGLYIEVFETWLERI